LPGKTIRVVLAEDSPMDAELASYALKQHGISAVVVVAASVPEFRAALLAAPTDVVISDYSMPAMDGNIAYEIARELVPDVPFIFLSGSVFHRGSRSEPPLEGATAALDKEDMNQLGAVVERALSKSARS
jgi:CheY-like chemotaxis protein